MQENLASLLCYAGGWITGLIFLRIDKRPAVRFHAMQSVVVFGALTVLDIVFAGVVGTGLLLTALDLVATALWVFLMVKAYQGQRYELPVAADIVKALSGTFDKIAPGSATEPEYVNVGAPAAPSPPVTTRASAPAANPAQSRLDALALPPEIVQRLRGLVQSWKQAEALRQKGVDAPQRVLLLGAPGTGKTAIAQALAADAQLAFMPVNVSDVKSTYVGQSANNVLQIFQQASTQAPCLLFFDEFDSIAPERGSPGADMLTNEIVAALIPEFDGVRSSSQSPVFVLAATRAPQQLDRAILSRFALRIEVPLPDAQTRQRILQTILAKWPFEGDAAQISAELAGKTDGLSPRDLNSLVSRAMQAAQERGGQAGQPAHIAITRADLLGQLPPASANAEAASA